jgi:hypothetical protein
VHPILECGAACWDPFRERQINVLNQVLNKVAKFANLLNDSHWEMAQHREIAHTCAVYKVYSGELAWKAVGDITKAILSEHGQSWLENLEQEAEDGYQEMFLCN